MPDETYVQSAGEICATSGVCALGVANGEHDIHVSELPLYGSSIAPLEIRGHLNCKTEYVLEHAGYMTYTLRIRDLRSDTEIHVSDHKTIRRALVQLKRYPSVVGTDA